MLFDDIDEQYEAIAHGLWKRIPILEHSTPSMYSRNGEALFLKSLGEVVGARERDFRDVKRCFWQVFELRKKAPPITHASPQVARLRHEFELALDQVLLARWIRDHFQHLDDPELFEVLDDDPEAND